MPGNMERLVILMNGFVVEDDALVWKKGNETLRIQPWGRDGLRVQSTMLPEFRDDLPHALLNIDNPKPEIEIGKELTSITNGKTRATVTNEGQIRYFKTGTDEILTEEPPPHLLNPDARLYKPIANDSFRVEARFNAYDDERIYGLGQHRHGYLNQKGCVIELAHTNCEIAIPFLISSRGYGFLWNNPAVGRVELGANGTRWVADSSKQLLVKFSTHSMEEKISRVKLSGFSTTSHSAMTPPV
jgi:alpha-D-xyloside xylohydrolase